MARVEFADPLGNAVSGFVEGRKMRLAEQQVMYDTVVAPAMRFKEMILDAQLKAGLMGLRGGGGHGGGGGGGGWGGVGTSIYGPGGAPNPAAPLPQPTGTGVPGLAALTAASGASVGASGANEALPEYLTRAPTGVSPIMPVSRADAYSVGQAPAGEQAARAAASQRAFDLMNSGQSAQSAFNTLNVVPNDVSTVVPLPYTPQSNPLAESLRTRATAPSTPDSFGVTSPRDRALLEYLGYGG